MSIPQLYLSVHGWIFEQVNNSFGQFSYRIQYTVTVRI